MIRLNYCGYVFQDIRYAEAEKAASRKWCIDPQLGVANGTQSNDVPHLVSGDGDGCDDDDDDHHHHQNGSQGQESWVKSL